MTRLEKIKELGRIEITKRGFGDQLKAINSHYYKSGQMILSAEDIDLFNFDEITPRPIAINFEKELMIDYIKSEIEHLAERSIQIVKQL